MHEPVCQLLREPERTCGHFKFNGPCPENLRAYSTRRATVYCIMYSYRAVKLGSRVAFVSHKNTIKISSADSRASRLCKFQGGMGHYVAIIIVIRVHSLWVLITESPFRHIVCAVCRGSIRRSSSSLFNAALTISDRDYFHLKEWTLCTEHVSNSPPATRCTIKATSSPCYLIYSGQPDALEVTRRERVMLRNAHVQVQFNRDPNQNWHLPLFFRRPSSHILPAMASLQVRYRRRCHR